MARSATSLAKHLAQRRAILNGLKNVPCKDCGHRFPPECMDFDHLNPAEKRRGVGNMMNNALPLMMAEAAKCEVVCANCHRIRTVARRRNRHG